MIRRCKKQEARHSPGFCFLKRSNILIKEVLELFIGKHFINELEDRLIVLFIELLGQPHLLHGSFIFDHYLLRHLPIIVNDLISGQVKELRHFLQFLHGEVACSLFDLTVRGLIDTDMCDDVQPRKFKHLNRV